ncbi:MAG: PhzF family phenazine biosynthesis protein, partial [Aestuariivirgaceae bacterium]
MALPFHTLDVFTNKRFAGNPLAVVLDAGGLNDRHMQSAAREFNLSETVFVLPPDDPVNTAKVRIFMPTGELPFAGHPTIGTAVLLASLSSTELSEIRLEERVGLVPVSIAVVNGHWHGTLTGAVMPSPVGIAVDDNAMAAAIGLRPEEIGFEGHRPGMFDAGVPYLFIPVRDLQALGNTRVVEPHWSRMTAACGTDGAYIYTAGNGDVNWRARLYAPEAGIPEDPATGSAVA